VYTAPLSLVSQVSETSRIKPPDGPLKPEELNPLLGERPREVLARLAGLCSRLPEISAGMQFGSPVWKAGKKTFVCAHHHAGRLYLQFWVGVEQQALLTSDTRYSISRYIGQNGWIDLDVQEWINWPEVDSLLQASYRHFALKRMIKALSSRPERP
ncbi:MAG: MmcQ/YjbR family DNA-binding protein, partial [Lysobacterales bacterium]